MRTDFMTCVVATLAFAFLATDVLLMAGLVALTL